MSYHAEFMHPELRVQAQYDVRSDMPTADQAGLLIPKVATSASCSLHSTTSTPSYKCGADTSAVRFDTALRQRHAESKTDIEGAKGLAKDIRRAYGSHTVWCPMFRERIERRCMCECDADCGCPDCEACDCKCAHVPVYQTKTTPFLSSYTSNVATVAQARATRHPLRSNLNDGAQMIEMKPAKFTPSLTNSKFRNNEFRDEWQSKQDRGSEYPGLVSVRVDTYSSLNESKSAKPASTPVRPTPARRASVEDVVNGSVLVAQREAALLAWKQRRIKDIRTQRYAKENYSSKTSLKFAPYDTAHYLKKNEEQFNFPASKETIAVTQRYETALKNLNSTRKKRLQFEGENMDVLGPTLWKRGCSQPEGEELDLKGLYKWAFSSEKARNSVFSTKRDINATDPSDKRLKQLRRGADRYTADDEDEVAFEGNSLTVRNFGQDDSEAKSRVLSGMTQAMQSQNFRAGPRDLRELANSHVESANASTPSKYLSESVKRKEHSLAFHKDRVVNEKLNAFDRARQERWDDYRRKLGYERVSELPEAIVQDIEAMNEAQKNLVKLLKSELKGKYQLRKENEATRRDAWRIQQALHEQTLQVSQLRNLFAKIEQDKHDKIRHIRELYGEDDPVSSSFASSSSDRLISVDLDVLAQPIQSIDLTDSLLDAYKSVDYLSGLFTAQLALPLGQNPVQSSEKEHIEEVEVTPQNIVRGLMTSYLHSSPNESYDCQHEDRELLEGCYPPDLVAALTLSAKNNLAFSSTSEIGKERSEELEPELKMELERIEAGISDMNDHSLGCQDPDLVYPSAYALLLGVGHSGVDGWEQI